MLLFCKSCFYILRYIGLFYLTAALHELFHSPLSCRPAARLLSPQGACWQLGRSLPFFVADMQLKAGKFQSLILPRFILSRTRDLSEPFYAIVGCQHWKSPSEPTWEGSGLGTSQRSVEPSSCLNPSEVQGGDLPCREHSDGTAGSWLHSCGDLRHGAAWVGCMSDIRDVEPRGGNRYVPELLKSNRSVARSDKSQTRATR